MEAQEIQARKRGLSGSTLKIIAMVTMLIDHIGAAVIERGFLLDRLQAEGMRLDFTMIRDNFTSLSPALQEAFMADAVLRLIGRIAFPIFCFLLVEGFIHTRSKARYAGRLLVVALLSEIPFDYAIYGGENIWGAQNVLWTLLFGLLGLWAWEGVRDLSRRHFKRDIGVLGFLAAVPFMALAEFCHTDYGAFGVFLIAILYIPLAGHVKKARLAQSLSGALCVAFEFTAPLAFVLTYFYNGKRGLDIKWLFYFFYPVHLAILYGIRILFIT